MEGKPSKGRRAGAGIVTEFSAIMDAIRHIVRVLRISSRAAEKQVGLSAAQLFVLQQLDGERALSLGDVAERTFTHQSSVSVVVSRLVERGMVRRRRAAADARRLELELTPRGRAVLQRAPDAPQADVVRAIGRLSAAERRTLARGLTRLVVELGVQGTAAQMLFEDER